MTQAPARFPDVQALSAGLRDVLGGDVRILERVRAVWASTYPAEIITCERGHREVLKLYCKYLAGLSYESFGHRGGLPYEINVYNRVLSSCPLPLARFYGAYEEPATSNLWLVLEYLDGSLRLPKGPQPESMVEAARWMGRFHAANEARSRSPEVSFLNRYDRDYYLGWVRRTLRFASELPSSLPWLAGLCARFEECVDILIASPATIIHGEFYPHNILIQGGEIYPIDWESAAIGAGEIDLATLTEAWTPTYLRQCGLAYRQARWNGTTPDGFDRRLNAARLYLCFRWMGEQPEWTLSKHNEFYFDQMRGLGEELGLI